MAWATSLRARHLRSPNYFSTLLTSKWDNLYDWAKTLGGFPLTPAMCYILNCPPLVPLLSIFQGSSVYPSSWEKVQQDLTWVLEKIMFSFIVGGSLLAVMEFCCIIQDYNVVLWCQEPYGNLVSPTTFRKLPLEKECAQWKITGEVPHTCAHVAYYNFEVDSIINRSVSGRPHQRDTFPWTLAVP